MNDATTNVVIEEGIETIGTGAFTGTKIQSVTLPTTLETWDAGSVMPDGSMVGVFQNCTSLTSVTISYVDNHWTFEGTKNIGSYAFYGCTALENIVFPICLVRVKERAFYAGLIFYIS